MDHNEIVRTESEERCCGRCANWLKLQHILGAGACSSEEVCKKFRNLPIVVTDYHEVCWCFEEDPYVKNPSQRGLDRS